MKKHRMARTLPFALTGLLAASFGGACSSGSGSSGIPSTISAIMFLQRIPRTDQGNVFDYTSFQAGGRIVKLEPPTANGKLTVLFPPANDPQFANSDVMSYDLSFKADSVVFSARLQDSGQYQIFTMNIDGSNIKQLTEGNDYVYPTFLPGGKIFYTTNRSVEPDANQFRDEYERATTAQVGIMNPDGTNAILGPRNVSHRVAPVLMPNGRVLYTEWRHMGMVNDGHLRQMNSDMTRMAEAFGGEVGGEGGTNSYLKARYVQTTPYQPLAGRTEEDPTAPTNYQMVAIATSRDRTIQAGKLYLINLNGSERYSWKTDLTPLVPGDRSPSQVGRYYDAEPIGNPADQQFLVSWADGPVESQTLDLAMTKPDFGVYLFHPDAQGGTRMPVYNDPNYWDVLARPIVQRPEPTATESPISGTSTTIGALNVYDSSVLTIPPGSVVKVRLIEGFSAEEGPRTFGTTEFDGQSLYAEIPIQPDNSFAAQVPGNVPFHQQLIDKYAMSIANESIWISGRAGEQRFCGGCHENRTTTPSLQPGQVDSLVRGAVNLDVARSLRVNTTAYQLSGGTVANASALRGVPWDKAIQPILDRACVSCHDGTPSAANPSFTATDTMTGVSQTFVFDLRGQNVQVNVGDRMTGDFTASYLSLAGLGELASETVTINPPSAKYGYIQGGSAKDSQVIQMLNPPQRFPNVDMTVRAFSGATHAAMVGGPELTADEYYLLILNIDMGGQFFFRENANEATQRY